jgi:xanthine dehydrogenase YagR molybdenum-binding subunit
MAVRHLDKLRSGIGTADEYQMPEATELPRWDREAVLQVVGQPHPRVEGKAKVTGSATYAYDVRLPGQLFTCVLRSPHPHARIQSIDTSKAEALPGVLAVISSENVARIRWFEDTVLFDRTVRYIGDEVAAVAAINEDIAEDALRLIDVAYEPLPFVTDLEAALGPDAPKVHEDGNIAGKTQTYQRGDVERGLRDADVTVDQVYTTQTALHNCLEPHGCTVTWEGDDLILWVSTQAIFDVRKEVAEKLELPEQRVRVIKQYMGGGFGSKQFAWKPTAIAALLSKQAGRPVQLMVDREAENLASGNRNATRQRVRLGARRDGTLTVIDVHIDQQTGAYRVGGEGADIAGTYQRLYRCPNVRTVQVPVYTNTGPACAFRAPGHVEGAFPFECAIDELARALDMDPLDLRLKNYTEEDQKQNKPYSSPESLRGCYDRAAETFGWRHYQRNRPVANGTKRRGIGLAAHDWGGSGYPPGYAWVKLNGDGSADVVTGTQDIGTGTRTGLAQIAAEELGLPMARIALHLGDTATGPYAPVSSGSATQATIGPAIRAAAAAAKAQLLETAGEFMKVTPERLILHDGTISVDDDPDRTMTIADVTGRIAPHMIQGFGARGPNPSDVSIRTFGAQCVEVEVDMETGEVTVLRVVASHDCGRIVNPTMVDSQVFGAVTQGLGYALTEERIVDHRYGVVLNANLEEYLVPTVADVPEITHARLGWPDTAANSTGAKGIGEPPLVPTAPAIANAIFDAVGVRIREAPLTRRRLLPALLEHHGPGEQQ